MADGGIITIESGVSLFTGKGFCHVRWGKEAGQLSPDEVRAMASHWFDVAAAADHDANLMAELQEGVGLDLETAGAILLALRERRAAGGG